MSLFFFHFCLFVFLSFQLINLYSMVTGRINHSQVILVGLFSLVNALINPILYGKMSQRYRKGYVYIFTKILSVCGGERPDNSFFGKFVLIFDWRPVSFIVNLWYVRSIQRALRQSREQQEATEKRTGGKREKGRTLFFLPHPNPFSFV